MVFFIILDVENEINRKVDKDVMPKSKEIDSFVLINVIWGYQII